MSINVSELIWAILCFLVLLVVLKKLLYDPVIRFMDARNAHVEEGLEAGRQAKQALEENDAALLEARKAKAAEAGAILQEAKAADEKARSDALHAAHQETAQSMKDVREQLKAEQASAEAELEGQLPELVDVLTHALLGKG